MIIEKQQIYQMTFPYAVLVCNRDGKKRVLCATETQGKCVSFDAKTGDDIETLWEGPGGSMSLVELSQDRFLVTHKFFKGFNSRESEVVYVSKENGEWNCKVIEKIPYLHRFSLMKQGDKTYFIGGRLCEDKENIADWSQAGAIYVGEYDDENQKLDAHKLPYEIHKNHGMYHGKYNGEECVMLTGVQGIFKVTPPKDDGEFEVCQIFEGETSEVIPYDIDGDGVDELITIQGFHGNSMVIYKLIDDAWTAIYEYPVCFGHALWCGEIFGRRSIVLGYKAANGGLYLLQPRKTDKMAMDITLIDDSMLVSNIDLWYDEQADEYNIYATCSVGEFNRYTLKKD